jgi:hypothetical protein
MCLYFRVRLNYREAFKAAGLIIAVVLVTSLTVYISWESLKSLDDTGFVKELQKPNLNINGSGNQYENTGKPEVLQDHEVFQIGQF